MKLPEHGPKNLECPQCKKSFKRKSDLNRHVKNKNCTEDLVCIQCQKQFTNIFNLNRHTQSKKCSKENVIKDLSCPQCQ